MKVLVLSLLIALATAMPQGSFETRREFGNTFGDSFNTRRVGHSVSSGFGSTSGFSSGQGHQGYTNCERREVSPGQYEYDCGSAQPGEIVDEKVLWVPYSGSDQNLLIRVPNYAVKDIVRAAVYPEGENSENIRIHVARPQLHSVVEGQFEKSVAPAPVVQLSYEPLVQEHEKVYGPPGEPFRPLTKRIDDQVGFRRGGVSGSNSNIGFGSSVSTGSSFNRPRPAFSSFGTTGSTGFGSSGSGFSSRSGLSSFPNNNNNNVGSGFNSGFSTGTGTGSTGFSHDSTVTGTF